MKTPPGKEKPQAEADKSPTEKEQLEKKKSTAKKVNGFNLWFSDNKGVLTEDNTELSSGDLVKLAMRTWKALSDEEKAEWNKKAKEASVDPEQGEKKRKRDKSDEENEDITNKLNQAKKAKEINNSASKLAEFAYSKKD